MWPISSNNAWGLGSLAVRGEPEFGLRLPDTSRHIHSAREREAANPACQEPGRKYILFCGLCHNESILLLSCESSHRRYIKEGYGFVPIKFYLQKQAVGRVESMGCILPTSAVDVI